MKTAIVFAALIAMLAPASGIAQPADDIRALTREVEGLKAGQAAILKELQELKSVMRQGAPAQQPQAAAPTARPAVPEIVDMVIDTAGAPIKGNKDAKVTVIEFTDYQCPFCARHVRQTWPLLEKEFVSSGKAKFVLRDLPIESIHPQAFKAAEAAHCAAAQGKFWEMHGHLFSNQSALARRDLSAHARALGLDVAAFDKCVDSGTHAAKVRRDIADSEKAGARGTPIFYVGLTDPGSTQIRAVRLIRGAHNFAVFKDTIEGLLSASP